MMFSFIWLLILTYAGLVSPADVYSSSQVRSIFILAGQSNMSGRGGVVNNTWNGVVPIQSKPNPTKILRLNAGLKWVGAQEPLHKDIDVNATCGVGPGMAFANSLLNQDPRIGTIGLVPCAVGSYMGTKISQWGRGTFLYRQLVRRTRAAAGDNMGKIRALLWYQGESDTKDPRDAVMYKRRLERMLNSLRADLQLPSLQVVVVAITSGQGPYVNVVRTAQFGLQLPNVMVVDAKGLPLSPDNLHLSTPAQVRLGEMIAKKIPPSD
ncbi:OLC1v1003910C1 [Oldenlandia corymbosa var. corymbosa]|uniref:OLC1v1003910C1 n=1 Tax=Oldenlandia corymbosa var. corymbosa TaxID=529605 RepID=A0AAV1DCA9_OLDCO|nr:OLC1v1003910C1 [Oldenlandia corymbosa var. corymbosa]